MRIGLLTINTDGPVEKYLVFPLTWVATIWWLLWWELEMVPGPHVVAGQLVSWLWSGVVGGNW